VLSLKPNLLYAPPMGLTALDMIVILLIAAGALVGWLRGFVSEILTLFAWFLAIMALRYLHAPVRDLLVHPVGTVAGASVLVTHLVFGLVFLGIAAYWALVTAGIVSSDRLGLLLPLTLVLAGAIGLVTIAARGLTRNRGQAVPLEHDPEVADLEAAAYAPYPRDVERTRILSAEQPGTDGDTDPKQGEDR